jgi:YD repeat-containing protein
LVLAAGGGLGGCAGKEPVAETNYVFYPPAPDEPRLQFLMSFEDAEHWKQRRRSTFSDFVVGAQPDIPGTITSPYGLAVSEGKLYVCDLGRRVVHVIDLVNRTYRTLGTPGDLQNPVNIKIDTDGTRYVCDTQRKRIAVYDRDDQLVKYLSDPSGAVAMDVAIGAEELYIANVDGATVEVWSKADGKPLRTLAHKGPGPDEVLMPTNLALGPDGLIYVTDTELAMVKVFTPQGNLVKTVGEPGDQPGYFARPKGLVFDPQGLLYVADAQWEVMQLFNSEGLLLLYFGEAGDGPQSTGMPAGLAIDTSAIEAMRPYISPTFEPQYLLFVANQFGKNKIGVYAFGHAKQQASSAE